jgi:hypothetical protein
MENTIYKRRELMDGEKVLVLEGFVLIWAGVCIMETMFITVFTELGEENGCV